MIFNLTNREIIFIIASLIIGFVIPLVIFYLRKRFKKKVVPKNFQQIGMIIYEAYIKALEANKTNTELAKALGEVYNIILDLQEKTNAKN